MKANNIIFVKGGTYRNIYKGLRRCIDHYFPEPDPKLTFELYKNGRSSYLIKADDGLDDETFYYIVNYLHHSSQANDKRVEVEGFTTGHGRSEIFLKKVLVYVSKDDEEGDNVFVVTSENKHYKIDFTGETFAIEDDKLYKSAPEFDGLEEPKLLLPRKRREPLDRKGIFKRNTPESRFKVFSSLFVGLFYCVLF